MEGLLGVAQVKEGRVLGGQGSELGCRWQGEFGEDEAEDREAGHWRKGPREQVHVQHSVGGWSQRGKHRALRRWEVTQEFRESLKDTVPAAGWHLK